MNRSLILILVTVAAALGLAACTSTPTPTQTPTPDNNATSTPPVPEPAVSVVTEVVTQTVTNAPAPPARPVIDSFGYGKLKLGMTRQQALDAKLIGPQLHGSDTGAHTCTLHDVIGTSEKTWVSTKLGVSTITFSPAMSSDGVGIGVTEAKLKAEYTNLKPIGPNYSYSAVADNNPAARFVFGLDKGKVVAAFISLADQDCHN
ncbi:hypothetical protein C8D88_101819 [Lentzea atacamensis]|uniref:Uncharacterized protein n=1 Tax=Lentzea atacamensis TaxID=531938 RepID=A0A316IB97_9PSEU|nr:hypothetical protein [Lentzea atacamensis]PWK90797.1 hypothetical protein C8D88_101819 [Lentzea atacamensis]RAS67978.1 hypothetical protein C8D87_10237 [Lentzea atacamensis]